MIKVKKGKVTIKGHGGAILSELTMAIKHVKTAFLENGIPEEAADRMISDAVRFAGMDTGELVNELVDRIGKCLERDDS